MLLALDVSAAARESGDAVEHHAEQHRQNHGGDGPVDLWHDFTDSSMASRANTTKASPRGPNQPMNTMLVGQPQTEPG